MKRAALWMCLLAGCGEPSAPLVAEPEEGSTGAARWEAPRHPADAAMLEHPARVVAEAAASGELGAPFRARVLRVHVQPGAEVAAGDPVLDVVMAEVLDAAAVVHGLRARITAHRARVEELERLRAEQLVDAARVFEQRAALAELEAERARALAVLRSASLDAHDAARVLREGAIALRAPSAGIVRSLDAPLGVTREPGGPPFARVVGSGAARVEVRSSEALPRAGALSFEGADGSSLALRAEPIAEVVDPADGMHVTWLAPSEPTQLADGLRGRVRVTIDGADHWEVPASALTIEEAGAQLTVRRDGTILRVGAEVLATSGASAMVRAPLAEGDLVARDPGALSGAPE